MLLSGGALTQHLKGPRLTFSPKGIWRGKGWGEAEREAGERTGGSVNFGRMS